MPSLRRGRAPARDRAPAGVLDARDDARRVADDLRGHVHGGEAAGVGALDVRRGHEGPVARDVGRVGDDEVDVAVDPAARVPAAAWELVADLDGDDVLRVAVGVRVLQVDREAGVAVRVAGDLLAVEEDDGVHVDAVELERDGLARVRAREREGLAVPAQAALEVAGVAGRALRRRVELDAPVVRQVDGAPRPVVVAGIGGVRVGAGRVGHVVGVGEGELPAATEVCAALRGAGRGGEHPDQRECDAPGQHRPAATRHDPLLSPSESLRKKTTETEGSVPAARGLETSAQAGATPTTSSRSSRPRKSDALRV